MDRRDFLKVVGAGAACTLIPFSGERLFPRKTENLTPVARISIDSRIGYRLPYRNARIRYVEFPVLDEITIDTADKRINWQGFNGCLQGHKLWDTWDKLVSLTICSPWDVYAEEIDYDNIDKWVDHPLRLWWGNELIEFPDFKLSSVMWQGHVFAEPPCDKHQPIMGHVQSLTYGTNMQDWFEQPLFFWEGIAPTVVGIEERFTNGVVREVEGFFNYKEVLEMARKHDLIYQPHNKFCHAPYKWSMPFTIGGEVAHFSLEHITNHSVWSNIYHS